MNSKLEFYLIVDGKKDPQKQTCDDDSTFNDLSDYIADKLGKDEDTSYIFYCSAEKKKKFALTKTLKQENIKSGNTVYAFEDGLIETYSFTIVIPQSDPISFDMPIDTTFHGLSDELITMKKENKNQFSYDFFKDVQKTQPYDPKKTLLKENIKNKQNIYGTQKWEEEGKV